MTRTLVCALAACAAAADAAPRAWTFVFIVDARAGGPRVTRQALESAGERIAALARRSPRFERILVARSSAAAAALDRAARDRSRGETRRVAVIFMGHAAPREDAHHQRPLWSLPRLRRALEGFARPGGPRLDLLVLHSCHSATLETCAEFAGCAQTLLASGGYIAASPRVYEETLPRVKPGDDAAAVARALARAGADAPWAAVSLEPRRFAAFLRAFDAFAGSLRRAVEFGLLGPEEARALLLESPRGMPPAAALRPLLRAAARAEWIPLDARNAARAALRALEPLVLAGGDRLLVRLGEAPGETNPAGAAWPRFLSVLREAGAAPAPRFLGWPLERALQRDAAALLK